MKRAAQSGLQRSMLYCSSRRHRIDRNRHDGANTLRATCRCVELRSTDDDRTSTEGTPAVRQAQRRADQGRVRAVPLHCQRQFRAGAVLRGSDRWRKLVRMAPPHRLRAGAAARARTAARRDRENARVLRDRLRGRALRDGAPPHQRGTLSARRPVSPAGCQSAKSIAVASRPFWLCTTLICTR